MDKITGKRKGEWLRKLFEILGQSPDGIRAGKALKELAERVTLAPHEQAIVAGVPRFEKAVRFGVLACARAGWVETDNGSWSLTESGRGALKNHADPEAFYREAVKLYQQWKTQKHGRSEADIKPTEQENPPGTEESAIITLERAAEQAWEEIEQRLHSMDPYDFQALVCNLLKGMGYYVLWEAPKGKDGGIDVIAASDPLGTKPPYLKVQVRRVQSATDVDAVKSFVASLNDKDVGVFVSAGGFTKPASAFARHQAKQTVTLVDLRRLFDLWVEFSPRLRDSERRLLWLKPVHFLVLEE
jgi:restriction system protein